MAARRIVALILTSIGLLPALSAPASADRSGDARATAHEETTHDPPAGVSRESQPRSSSVVVVRGNHRSIQVNVDAQGNNIVGDAANEPSIAIDPLDPQRIVIGWRQFDSVTSNFRQAGYGYSSDGGENWTFPGVLEPGQFRSDPVLAADGAGVFYYYSLQSTTAADMFISSDGGVSWLGPISAMGGDKTWMTIDVTEGLGDGQIYTIWNASFTCCAPGTDFTRSVDSGINYDGPFVMSSKVHWGTLDVGNDGEVYVVGVLGSGHAVVKSTDIWNSLVIPTFQTRTLSLGGSTEFQVPVNPAGLAGQVWLAVDRSNGATRGNVYVLGSVSRSPDPLDVMFTRSVDGGSTWSAPVRVNSDPPTNGAWQWFGTMSVAPNGRIDAVWNDTREDPAGIISEVYYAYSTDAGTTWSGGLPVTPAWDPTLGWPNQSKIGDYYDMISDENGAALAYAATFNGEEDVFFLRLGDCNANGQHDALDVATSASEDCDENLVPDECQENFSCYGPDTDGDGVPDVQDCAPDDPSAFHEPSEVSNVQFLEDEVTLTWDSQATTSGTGTTYDVARGDPKLLPVLADPTVTCEANVLSEATFIADAVPDPGRGHYYLVRGSNVCVTAGWGLDTNYSPRLTFVCDPPP